MTGIYVITYKAGGFYAKNMGIFVITYNVMGFLQKTCHVGTWRAGPAGQIRGQRGLSERFHDLVVFCHGLGKFW